VSVDSRRLTWLAADGALVTVSQIEETIAPRLKRHVDR
jgi:hypothetical protein